MKKLSLRIKLTLWFLSVITIIIALTFVAVFKISDSIIQKQIRDNLIVTVENNIDEIEYFKSLPPLENNSDRDQYIKFGNGYLEIDDDFLDSVNGVLTALYDSNSNLLYGETPGYQKISSVEYSDSELQTVTVEKTDYYVFDRALEGKGLNGLWLRGVVCEKQGEQQISNVVTISLVIMPLLLAIAAIGGYIIAGRALKPIDKISNLAANISRGNDLKKRIELNDGDDELHKLANVFNNMLERLDKTFENEQRFTSDASHELRTPVSVINAQCEFTLESEKSPQEYKNALKVIHRQSNKMSKLISDMLDYSRLEQNSYKYTLENLNFSDLAESVCSDMALIKENEITLKYSIQPNICVSGNQTLLTRLMSNLIGNAYKYGKHGGNISVSLVSYNNNAILSVTDDGIGISPADIDKIFNRFYRADASRNGKGTGLGLSLAKEIAVIHGGDIKVQSKIGQGSSFVLTLPKQI